MAINKVRARIILALCYILSACQVNSKNNIDLQRLEHIANIYPQKIKNYFSQNTKFNIDFQTENDCLFFVKIVQRANLIAFSNEIKHIFNEQSNISIKLECIKTLSLFNQLSSVHNNYVYNLCKIEFNTNNITPLSIEIMNTLYSVRSDNYVPFYLKILNDSNYLDNIKYYALINLLLINTSFSKQCFNNALKNIMSNAKLQNLLPSPMFLLGGYFLRSDELEQYSKLFLFANDWKERLAGIATYFSITPVSSYNNKLLLYLISVEKNYKVKVDLRERIKNFGAIYHGIDKLRAMTTNNIKDFISNFSNTISRIKNINKLNEISGSISTLNSYYNNLILNQLILLINNNDKNIAYNSIWILNRAIFSGGENIDNSKNDLVILYSNLLHKYINNSSILSEIFDGLFFLHIDDRRIVNDLLDILSNSKFKNIRIKAAKLLFYITGITYLGLDDISSLLYINR